MLTRNSGLSPDLGRCTAERSIVSFLGGFEAFLLHFDTRVFDELYPLEWSWEIGLVGLLGTLCDRLEPLLGLLAVPLWGRLVLPLVGRLEVPLCGRLAVEPL